MAEAADADTAEVHREHIEGRLRGAIEDGGGEHGGGIGVAWRQRFGDRIGGAVDIVGNDAGGKAGGVFRIHEAQNLFVVLHGADEAVILNTDGYILEGALSAIVWFRDDVLCAPGNDLDWIPSITRKEVFAIAEQMGLQTRTEKVKPADLVDLEIWGLSSLHGIRPVDEWVDLGGPVGQPRHLEAFNKRLRMLSTSID